MRPVTKIAIPAVSAQDPGTGGTVARAMPGPQLALSGVEKAAVVRLVQGAGAEVAEHVRTRATALSTGDAAVRRRSLSRAAAVAEAQMQELSALVAGAVARRDAALPAIDRALSSATNRYLALLDALRREASPGRRVMVMAKGTVAVAAEEA